MIFISRKACEIRDERGKRDTKHTETLPNTTVFALRIVVASSSYE